MITTVTTPAIFVYVQIKHQHIESYKLSKNGYIQINPAENFTITFLNPDCVAAFEENNIYILNVNDFIN